MTVANIKLKIFRQVETLDKSRLEEVYGLLTNYLRGHKDVDDWDQLSEEQKNGIFDAMEDLDKGKGIPHNKVMSNCRKKYV